MDFRPAVMQPDVPVSHDRPSPRSPRHCRGLLLIYRPLRDGWLSWPCWLTDSGRLNHKVQLEQDRESSPVAPSVLTTMLRRQTNKGQGITFLSETEDSTPVADVTWSTSFDLGDNNELCSRRSILSTSDHVLMSRRPADKDTCLFACHFPRHFVYPANFPQTTPG